MNYFTENNVNITKRIEDGNTVIVHGTSFVNKKTAQAIAKKMKSYVFDIYSDGEDKKRVRVGFGISK